MPCSGHPGTCSEFFFTFVTPKMFSMINNSEFASRLTEIMEYYQLSASAFSDKIQVPRSSISHLLSSRNRPSLDFVMKVVREFKEVELYWLLNGKGSFPSGEASPPENLPIPDHSEKGNHLDRESKAGSELGSDKKEIERIVFFYKDGSFKEYRS